jgi:hypothetical protein
MKMHDEHARHDRFLVAALAANDLEGQARIDADELVAACTDCAELLADLRSIAAATAALPMLPRSTDFRLSPETAERLGARGWRGFLVRLADSRFGFSRPLAVGLTTLGLVGVIAGSIPGAMGGYGSGAPVLPAVGNYSAGERQGDRAAGTGAPPATSEPAWGVSSPVTVTSGSPVPLNLHPPAATPASGFASPAADAMGGVRTQATPAPSAPPTPTDQASKSNEDALLGLRDLGSGPAGPPPLLVGSLVLLLIGLGILGTQWAATRLTNGTPNRP